MKLELEFGDALCCTAKFVINGIEARHEDFGSKQDEDPDNAEDYGCGNMQYKGVPPKKELLDKYGITAVEYNFIVGQLEDGLSFGRCGWCV